MFSRVSTDLWYEAGGFLSSFLEADIFCIKKTGDLTNLLNYRPLALLNSDYKVFTRILATRISALLLRLIHQQQAGFIPGRQIHDTIDLFAAAQVSAESARDQQLALAMMLDYEKAYDALARMFLVMVLRWLGFPERYITALLFLHNGTPW
ncbi:unnamed protein product [Phytophthora fragariaefolia]|uniref:Unnamed protein product n=1 Tax=Phytophthora fragariaefolia TaxID=1490495 RepID=A0A9W7CVI3_9STRA|nr:unnamed protein product [Phytophthora fragariaefolia]